MVWTVPLFAGAVRAEPFAYVANLESNDVSVINLAEGSVVATIAVGEDPDGIAIAPDGSRAYVANFFSGDLTVIDTARQEVLETISVGSGPVGVAVSPDGQLVFVANRRSDSVSIVDAVSLTVVETVAVEPGPNAVSVTTDGATAMVTNSHTKFPGLVTFIDIAGVSAGTVAVQRNPNRVATSPDGLTGYVTNFRSWNVSVLDIETREAVTTVRVSGRPSGIGINPNGSFVYVTTLDGFLQVIDTLTFRVHTKIRVGSRPSGIGIVRNGALGYVANFGDNTVTPIDLVHHQAMDPISVGGGPFAVGVNCVAEACSEPPLTALPTNTPTLTLTASRTPTITRTPTRTITRTLTTTPTVTVTPVLSGDEPVIRSSSATVRPGDVALIQVSLDTRGVEIAEIKHNIRLAPTLTFPRGATRNSIDCIRNAAIRKNATVIEASDGCRFGCSIADVVVDARDTREAIPDGSVLYSCRIDIPFDAEQGAYLFEVRDPIAFAPDRGEIEIFARSSQIVVSGEPRPTSTPRFSATPTATVPTPTPTLRGDEIIVAGSRVAVTAGGVGSMTFTLLQAFRKEVTSIGFAVDFGEIATILGNRNDLACEAHPEIQKNASHLITVSEECDVDKCARVTVAIFDFQNSTALVSGDELFSCAIRVRDDTAPGTYVVSVDEVDGSTPEGEQLPAIGQAGRIIVGTGPNDQEPAVVTILSVWAAPGASTSQSTVIHPGIPAIKHISFEMELGDRLSIAGRAPGVTECHFNPDITGPSSKVTLLPDGCTGDFAGTCSAALVTIDFVDGASDAINSVLYPTTVYTCRYRVGFAATPGVQYPIGVSTQRADSPNGESIALSVEHRSIVVQPHAVGTLAAGDYQIASGGEIDISVDLESSGEDVAGTQNRIVLPPGLEFVVDEQGEPVCAANPEINRRASAFALLPNGCIASECRELVAVIISFDNTDPIPDGSDLYSCRIKTNSGTRPGIYRIEIEETGAASPQGDAVSVRGENGSLQVGFDLPSATILSVTDSTVDPGQSTVISFFAQPWTAAIEYLDLDMHLPSALAVDLPDGTPDCWPLPGVDPSRSYFHVSGSECTDEDGRCQTLNAGFEFDSHGPAREKGLFACRIQADIGAEPGTYPLTPLYTGAYGRNGFEVVNLLSPKVHVRGDNLVFIGATSHNVTPNSEITVHVSLQGTAIDVAGIENILELAPGLTFPSVSGSPCTVNPFIDKNASAFSYRPQGCTDDCTYAKALILSIDNTDPIPTGSTLYSCRIAAGNVEPGQGLAVDLFETAGSTTDGLPVEVDGRQGTLTVVADTGVPSTVLRRTSTNESSPGTSTMLCSRGPESGQPCTSDATCIDGACVRAPGVCEGGDDDGLVCACSGGRCIGTSPACDASLDGQCAGGSQEGQCCRTGLNCSGDSACVGTQRVCAGGASKGLPCLENRHCLNSVCVETLSRCIGGDFAGFACIDDSDCPLGACQRRIPPTNTPGPSLNTPVAAPPTPTNPNATPPPHTATPRGDTSHTPTALPAATSTPTIPGTPTATPAAVATTTVTQPQATATQRADQLTPTPILPTRTPTPTATSRKHENDDGCRITGDADAARLPAWMLVLSALVIGRATRRRVPARGGARR